ncbi:unnamed protein product [Polarella glacialis]|uniref:Uncharacterized protein n=3 Tax=Polarella glacialis TaxID=89957 RepID=A0A813JIQ7_POLGL|nr:unnamed protein product [Polarella glacialis]
MDCPFGMARTCSDAIRDAMTNQAAAEVGASFSSYYLPTDLMVGMEASSTLLLGNLLDADDCNAPGLETKDRRRRLRRRKAHGRESAIDKEADLTAPDESSSAFAFFGLDDGLSTSPGSSGSSFSTVSSASPLDHPGAEAQVAASLQSSMPKWHSSALSAGHLSEDGHIFSKTHAGPRKNHASGMTLSSLCMLFEENLRVGGVHQYHYSILEGSVGAADGVGFVFDARIRRTNIQRMRSVFLNKHGQVCVRNLDSITKLDCSLPKLSQGMSVVLTVDLDRAAACFQMYDPCGKFCGITDFSFASMISEKGATAGPGNHSSLGRSGFFCAIVTGNISVSLQ